MKTPLTRTMLSIQVCFSLLWRRAFSPAIADLPFDPSTSSGSSRARSRDDKLRASRACRGMKGSRYDLNVQIARMAVVGLVIGAVTLAAQAPPAPATPPAAAPAGSVEKGRLTFAKVGCSQCHGGEAQGSPTTGPRLGPAGLPYVSFSRYVRAPSQQMPPYTETILANAELADIYAFVQSRPKASTPPLLRP